MPDGALLEGLGIRENAKALLGLFERLLLESAGPAEVAAGAGRGIGGGDGLLRVEVGAGHLLEGLGVGQDAKALGQVLVELCDHHLFICLRMRAARGEREEKRGQDGGERY